MTTGSLWVARHAPADVTNTCYGRTDVPTKIPHDRAAATLLGAYPGAPPDAIWSSPLSRCRAVAERMARHHACALRIDASLHELDFGTWEGCTWSALERRDPHAYARWMEHWEEVAPPGGEGLAALEARARAWFECLEKTEKHVLIAHAGFVRALRVVSERCTWREAMERPVEHLTWLPFALPSLAPHAHVVKQAAW